VPRAANKTPALRPAQANPNRPEKPTCRRAVCDKFKNDKGGRYDPRLVNARYPVPDYLR
jgi:hypothetical protein